MIARVCTIHLLSLHLKDEKIIAEPPTQRIAAVQK